MLGTNAMKKVEKIRRIVQLKQVMKGWRALSFRRAGAGDSGGGSSRGAGSSGGSNRPVRAGFLAVYVGPDRCRFVIPTRFLNLPVLAALLERAEEEYGFQPAGGLSLPCDVAFFRWVVDALERDEPRFRDLGLDAFMDLFSELDHGHDAAASTCKEESALTAGRRSSAFSPLLQKARV